MQDSPPQYLTSQSELLYRQVHPSFVRAGRVSSQAFRPNKQDDGRLSVSRSALVTAKTAFERFVARGLHSAGAWGITVGEVIAVGLQSSSDKLPDDDAHAVVDFNGCPSKSQWDKISDKLAAHARTRGVPHAA